MKTAAAAHGALTGGFSGDPVEGEAGEAERLAPFIETIDGAVGERGNIRIAAGARLQRAGGKPGSAVVVAEIKREIAAGGVADGVTGAVELQVAGVGEDQPAGVARD